MADEFPIQLDRANTRGRAFASALATFWGRGIQSTTKSAVVNPSAKPTRSGPRVGESASYYVLLALFPFLAGLGPDDEVLTAKNMCGPNNLALVIAYLDGGSHDQRLEDNLKKGNSPYSLSELEGISRRMGYKTLTLHWQVPADARFDCPAILHVRNDHSAERPNHFIACFGKTKGGVCVADFPGRPRIVSDSHLQRIWDGDLLYLDRPDGRSLNALEPGWSFRFERVQPILLWTLFLAAVGLLAVRIVDLLRRLRKRISAS
jgi:Peptidase C39 family